MSVQQPTQACFHCGEAIPQGSQWTVVSGGRTRQVCSQSCQETVDWINNTGLSDFYRLRKGYSTRSQHEQLDQSWSAPEIVQQVLRDKGQGIWEVSLLVDGMHCAGCVWLIERALLKLGGVSDIQINPVTHRALLNFDETKVSLEDILYCLQNAGYAPRPLQVTSLDEARKTENRNLLKRLLVAGFGMMQVMTFAFVLYMENFGELPEGTKELFRWLGFLVATPIVFYSAAPFYSSAKNALKMKLLNMDVPIAIAITAVYSTSVYQVLMAQGEVYFESVTMLVFFLLIGRYVEMRARHHSVNNADALIRLTPAFAEKIHSDGTIETVAISQIQPGDRVRVMEGAHVPADGVLLSKQTKLDEALLSGEASANVRLQNDTVIAGSLVLQGPIDIQVTHVGQDTFLSQLAHLSTKAQTERPKLTRRSEKATAHFVMRVLVATSVALAGWLYVDPSQALEATIALLVVACPCALGLAAPAAITRALGVLAQRNILVVKPDALETINQIDTVIFDKTGTLTEPHVDVSGADKTALQFAASLARESQHPLSRALLAANTEPLLAVQAPQSHVGLGLEGEINGRSLKLGQAKFAVDAKFFEQANDASLVLGENGQWLASFAVDERLRDDALSTVQNLQQNGLNCRVVSGDSENRVQAIATRLGIAAWHSRQLPADKLGLIKNLHEQQHRVLMVGDGSNDAPVLAGADVSVALTSGTELAQANADILFCDGRLANVVALREIAEQTQHILQQNMRWAMMYNTLAMPTAALGFIPPWLAAIFMSASSLMVVLNALRIGRTSK